MKFLLTIGISGLAIMGMNWYYKTWRQQYPEWIREQITFKDWLSHRYPGLGFRNADQLWVDAARAKINYNAVDAYGGGPRRHAIYYVGADGRLTPEYIIEQIRKYRDALADGDRLDFIIFTIQQIPNLSTVSRIIVHNQSNHILQIQTTPTQDMTDNTVYIQV